jgi:hypothetical protein
MKAMFACVAATVALMLVLGVNMAGEKDKKDKTDAKYKIADVMKEIMKSGLGKKVFAGEGSKEENKKVLEYFIELHKNTPPKGEKDTWNKVTQTLVDTAKKIEAGEEKGSKKLAAIINCTFCHKTFKSE